MIGRVQEKTESEEFIEKHKGNKEDYTSIPHTTSDLRHAGGVVPCKIFHYSII